MTANKARKDLGPHTLHRPRRQLRLAILGLGKMGGILMQALQKRNVVQAKNVCATVQHADRAATLSTKYGIKVTTDNRAAVREADIILLCVKPQTLGEVVSEIQSELRPNHLIVSIAASVPTAYIEKRIPAGVPVIRAMPNTPSMVGAGMTAFCCGRSVKPADLEVAQTLFGTVGEVVRVDEKHM